MCVCVYYFGFQLITVCTVILFASLMTSDVTSLFNVSSLEFGLSDIWVLSSIIFLTNDWSIFPLIKKVNWSLQIYIYIYIHIGAGHIIRIPSKSWFISLIPFKKWNLYNVYIHSTQTDIFQVFICFNFDDYNWQLMKTPNSVSTKIWILWKGSILKTPGATL